MALSIILRRSASRVIGGGNRLIYGNLIVPSAANSVPSLRQFCSSPCLSCQDNESLVKEAKRPRFDESLVNDLMSQVQALQRDLESLRKSYGKENESLVVGESMDDDQSESVHEGSIDEDSSLKHLVNESSNDEGEGEDLESDKSSDEGKDSECDSDDDDSKQKSSSESDKSDHESRSEDSDWDSDDDDSKQKSCSESDNSDHESLSLSERDDKPDDDKSVPTKNENEELIKGIEEEIALAKQFMELSAPDTIIPPDFPFEIGRYWSSSIFLTREYGGEVVQVLVENPTIFLHDSGSGYNQKKSSSFSMGLTVSVLCTTSNLSKFELKCGASPEGISIYSMTDPPPYGSDTGVHMSEFSENLKGGFLKYLEARGITEKTTKFLYGYMLDKANRDKLMILENIHKMLV